MRKRGLSVLGLLVVSALAAQVAAAAPHSGGKAARASTHLNQQYRDVFDSDIRIGFTQNAQSSRILRFGFQPIDQDLMSPAKCRSGRCLR